jgi:hypothetical protein
MRQSLLHTFDQVAVLDLHGNSKKPENPPPGVVDGNVFEIQQGVAIGALVARPPSQRRARRTTHGDLWGRREEKYGVLLRETLTALCVSSIFPTTPLYLFLPQDAELAEEYGRGTRIVDVMPVNCIGFQSHRDSLVIDFDKTALLQRIARFADLAIPDGTIQEELGARTTGTWSLPEARRAVARDLAESHILPCFYRPFDKRYVYYHDAVVERRLFSVLGHLTRPNLAIATMRQTRAPHWRHALVTSTPVPAVYAEIKDGTSIFPLYLYPDIDGHKLLPGYGMALSDGRVANLAAAWVGDLASHLGLRRGGLPRGTLEPGGTLGPEDILHYN